jgi:hypothetical protein
MFPMGFETDRDFILHNILMKKILMKILYLIKDNNKNQVFFPDEIYKLGPDGHDGLVHEES